MEFRQTGVFLAGKVPSRNVFVPDFWLPAILPYCSNGTVPTCRLVRAWGI